MDKRWEFSPAMISSLFNINKSTLLRWEREGLLPQVRRDYSSRLGERAYTQADVQAIYRRQREQLKRQYGQVSKVGDQELRSGAVPSEGDETHKHLQAILERSMLQKFLAGDPTGLAELRACKSLLPETIERLAQVAIDQTEPGAKWYAEIMAVVAEQSAKLAPAL